MQVDWFHMNVFQKIVHSIKTHIWWRRLFYVSAGALIGFAYYRFIGCYSGTCPITSNPYLMIGYGAIVGILLSQKR